MLTNIRNFAITFLVAALLFGTAAYFISKTIVNSFSEDPTDKTDNTETSDTIDFPIEDGINFSYSDNYTVLLIGTDFTKENSDYDLSVMNETNNGFYYKERHICADAVMLVHFSKATKEVLFASIPGDMNVTLNGVNIPFSRAYDYVDKDYFVRMITSLTGMNIDNYFTVSIDGFKNIIDGIGGLTFEVPTDMKYTDKSQKLYIDLKSGEQTLDGENACNMLRYVSYSEGNVTRMNVAIKFAKALFSKLSSSTNIKKSVKLYSLVSSNVETDFTISDLSENLDLLFSYSTFNTVEYTYPVSSTYNEDKDINVTTPNTEKAYSFFEKYKDK